MFRHFTSVLSRSQLDSNYICNKKTPTGQTQKQILYIYKKHTHKTLLKPLLTIKVKKKKKKKNKRKKNKVLFGLQQI